MICYGPVEALPVLLLYAALSLGLRVPEDLSLVTFHDEPGGCSITSSPRWRCPTRRWPSSQSAISPLPFGLRSIHGVAPPLGARPRRRR